MKLIDKATVVAEIDKWRHGIKIGIDAIPLTGRERADSAFEYEILGKIKDYINTLEVKDVDLEKEIDSLWNPRFNLGWDEKSLLSINHEGFTHIAKYFFELGLKTNVRQI